MKEMNHSHPVTLPAMQRNRNTEGIPVLRDLEGHMCANCGSLRYFLVFRPSGDGRSGTLEARCTRCREPKELTPSEIEAECQPELRTH